jgi:hypothetical protein
MSLLWCPPRNPGIYNDGIDFDGNPCSLYCNVAENLSVFSADIETGSGLIQGRFDDDTPCYDDL